MATHSAARARRAVPLVLSLVAIAGCGKKGAPLPPLVRVPVAIERIEARRVGDDVLLALTVPAKNLDSSLPVDVHRIEVYAFSSLTAPPRARFIEVARLVRTVPVVSPPPPRGGGAPAPPPPPPPPGTAVPGAVITIRDTLEPDDLVPHEIPPPPGQRPAPPPRRGAVVFTPPPAATELRRYYLAVPFSSKGIPGPPSPLVSLPLTQLPQPPEAPVVTYAANTLALEWQPAGGLLGALLDRELQPEAPPSDRFDPASFRGPALVPGNMPAGPTRYNVYRELAPDPLVLPVRRTVPQEWASNTGAPLQATPLTASTFSEAIRLDGRRVCYTVRAVRGVPPNAVEGFPSERVCVTPVDVFAPTTPVGLSAVAVVGSIDLLWEPNVDADLGGYLVLRGNAGDATLAPLVERPIAETRYSDRTVVPGRRYVYAVVALDSRLPVPNASAESARVEEVAR